MKLSAVLAAVACAAVTGVAHAQEPVVPAADVDALFHSSDPRLDANKQVIYHLMKDVLMAGHVELADRYMTERYIQHNPNFGSGRAMLVKMIGSMGPARPIATTLAMPIVSVVAEGDLVVVAQVSRRPDPDNPSVTHTTTGFDMWRIRDGKADEHWDALSFGKPPAPGRGPPPPPPN